MRTTCPYCGVGCGIVATPDDRGGVAITGLPTVHRVPAHKVPAPPGPSTPGSWLTGTTVTEYWPAPESWFRGELVSAPGLSSGHRIDWLYSATGVSMEGEGIGLDGRMYHIEDLGNGGWVTAAGRPTSAVNDWSAGAPFWRAGEFWRNSLGAVTFPLASGRWSAGPGRRFVPLLGVTFAPGAPLQLRFSRSVAVDPTVIPLGSRIYIPAYRNDGYGGWFLAQDTGGGIIGRHVDVYRSPPSSPGVGGEYLADQRVFVSRPHG